MRAIHEEAGLRQKTTTRHVRQRDSGEVAAVLADAVRADTVVLGQARIDEGVVGCQKLGEWSATGDLLLEEQQAFLLRRFSQRFVVLRVDELRRGLELLHVAYAQPLAAEVDCELGRLVTVEHTLDLLS